MKIFILLTLLFISLVASSFEQDYKNLNQELDKVSTHFTTEEKIKIFYFVSKSYEKMNSSFSSDAKLLKEFNTLEEKMFKLLSQSHKKNKKITNQETKNIWNLYTKMLQNYKKLVKSKENLSGNTKIVIEEKIIYKDKIIYKEKIVQEYSKIFLFLISIISLIVGVVVTFFILKKSQIKENKDELSKIMIQNLQHRNIDLQQSIKTSQRTNAECNKRSQELYENEIKLQRKIKKLEEKFSKLD